MKSGSQFRLDGKVAIVTGSTAGWGLGVAQELARRGAAVCINGRNAATVERAVDDITQWGGQAIGVVGDVSISTDVDRLVATATDQLGRLDIMINNVALFVPCSVLDQTDDGWRSTMASTLDSVFFGVRAAARVFVRQGTGGRIINMAASSGVYGIANAAHTAAAKGGVLAATYSWALELAEHGITVNAVRAGVDTPGAAELVQKAIDGLKAAGMVVPEDRRELGVFPPSEAAGFVVWLASDEASEVTGRFIGVDGPKLALWEVGSPAHVLWHEPYWDADSVARELPALVRAHNTQPHGIGKLNPAYNYVYGTHERE